MILGSNHPGILIAPFDHGIQMDPVNPYSYIRALYNLFVCGIVAILITITTYYQKKVIALIRKKKNHRQLMFGLTTAAVILFLIILFELLPIVYLLAASIILIVAIALATTYYVSYNERLQTEGLTAWSLNKAKRMFKGSKINDREGSIVKVHWKIKKGKEETINLSQADMRKMAANEGDLVYLCDARKILGGLKSIHSVIGKPHKEEDIVYITKEQFLSGVFVKGKILTAEKEM